MRIENKIIRLRTREGIGFINLTDQIKRLVGQSKVRNGTVNVSVRHTTAGIRINENEKRLFEDMSLFLEKIAPKKTRYLHDDVHLRDCPPNERLNGHAHLKSLILNTTESVPIMDGNMALGTWQNVFFIELDGTRNREIFIQIIGE